RFAYVFGDPRNAVISFFQRKVTRHDRHGFQWSKDHLNPYPNWTTLAVKNLQAEPVGLTKDWDVTDLIERRVDPFQFEDHFRRWTSYAIELPVTFIRYETLWDHVPLLASLFSADVAAFPPRIPQRTRWH